MCFVEVIDTGGQGMSLIVISTLLSSCMSHRGTCTDLAWSTVTVSTSLIDCQIHDFDVHAILFSTEQGFILVYSIASKSTFDRLKILCQSI